MKILRQYVCDTLRQNKRSSIVIIIALFLMTTLMSCFCGLVYTMWTDAVVLEKWHNGDWHGELFDNTPGSSLERIENHASVSAVLIKGKWETARLTDKGKRIYLVFRGANQEYWDSMPEKYSITEGRIPQTEQEIALSKQFFEDYPDIKVGDTLTLPVGQRTLNGRACMATETFHEGETFQETGTKTWRITGMMDVTTSSAVPAYTGMTWLDHASIQPEDLLTVYLRFSPMRQTYQELPALADAIGYDKNEYGNYQLRYNTGLLSTYGILPPEEHTLPAKLNWLLIPIMFLTFTVCLIAVFVLVIHNAFTMSVNEKLTQLGTLSGIGATPKQIKKTVRTEALLLASLPLPLGIFAGWLLVEKLFAMINASNDLGREAPDIIVTFGLPAILPAILLSLLTAWLSAEIPAKKAARLLPVEILKQEGELNKKKRERKRSHYFFGITGELASNALSARRASYRMATISLCMSFLLLTIFQYIVTTQKANDAIFRTNPEESGQIFLSISDGLPPDIETLEAIRNTPGITKSVLYNTLSCAIWVDKEKASEDIDHWLGGFDSIVAKKKYSLIKRDGQYRMASAIIGLEEHDFRDYCIRIGISPEPYFSDSSKAVVYNYTKDPESSTRRNVLYRELLDLHEGENLTFTEKNQDEIEGDFEFTLTAEKLTDQLPMETFGLSNYTLALIMPMEQVLELSTFCCERRQNSTRNISGTLWIDTAAGLSYPVLQNITKQVEQQIAHHYGSGDYLISDLAEREEMAADSARVMNLIIVFLTLFLALIGLSNVWASILGNLRQRRREFAMLRSVGLSPRQLWRLCLLEGVTLGLKPLLYSLPIQAAVLAAMLSLSEISLLEYLPFAPTGIILGYTCLILLAITGAYAVGGRRLQRETIITAVKDDTI